VRVLLWVLAAINTLAVVGFFAAIKAAGETYGIVSPAFGFYLALIALITSIVGTIMMQTVKQTRLVANINDQFAQTATVVH
jgi:hypothetical protein